MIRALERREPVVSGVISEIKRALISGGIKLGDKLPPEIDLAKKLGVSRNVVREATKMLVAMGIVDIKRGDGTYIKKNISSNILDPLVLKLVLSKGNPQELLELREMVELGTLYSVMKNVRTEDIVKMEEVNRLFEIEFQKEKADVNVMVALDLQFHYALVAASHNDFIQQIATTILGMFTPLIKESLFRMGVKQAISIHKKIIELIREGNWTKASNFLVAAFEREKKDLKGITFPES